MSRASLVPGALAGLALWCTAGSLDAVEGPSGAVRVAMLPPLWLAAALAIAGAAATAAVTRVVARLATGGWRPPTPADTEVVAPLAMTACLALPYLPWLADVLPAWTTLASPFAIVVWLVAVALTLRAAALRVAGTRARRTFAGRRETVAIFALTAAVCGAAATRLVGTPIFPGGDEPHYLVIAQSLWRDGDLKIENNHRRGDTFEYFARPLKPDYLTRGADREIYSIHPVGVAVLLAPVYALGGYRGSVTVLILLAAAAATLAWRLAARVVDRESARFGWAAVALTAPWVFNSFTVYPEVPAALATIVAFAIAVRLDERATRRALIAAAFVSGVAIATLPWLSSKYALMGAGLGGVLMARLWRPAWLADADRPLPAWPMRDRLLASIAAAAAPLVSGVSWLLFFKMIWGTYSPSAPYGSQHAMDVGYLAAGGPGLYFDQEYGVVAAAPVLLLAFGGLAGMLRAGGRARRLALEIALISIALLVTVAAFHIWWGGTAAVGRPIIAALLLLVVPCAWQMRAWTRASAPRAAAWLLLAASLGILTTLAIAQQGLLLVAERDGASRLLSYWAPAWRLWSTAPSFVMQPPPRALIVMAIWIGSATIGFFALRRIGRDLPPGRASLGAAVAAFVALTAVAIAVEPVSGRQPLPSQRLSARARSPLLDTFDAARRPTAIAFDPMRRVAPRELTGLTRFVADARAPRDNVAAGLLHGARWALPAGEYDVEVIGVSPLAGELALQAGRVGPPLVTWRVDTQGASRWRGHFALPVDVGYIGFKTSAPLAAAQPRVEIRPASLVDLSRRLPFADVVQARVLAERLVFFHDDQADPEPAGFWTRRDRETAITLAASRPAALRLRSGPAPTRVVVRVAGTAETVDLGPNTSRDVALPTGAGPWRIVIATRGGFVPAEVDRTSRDLRALGCWIEVIDGL